MPAACVAANSSQGFRDLTKEEQAACETMKGKRANKARKVKRNFETANEEESEDGRGHDDVDQDPSDTENTGLSKQTVGRHEEGVQGPPSKRRRTDQTPSDTESSPEPTAKKGSTSKSSRTLAVLTKPRGSTTNQRSYPTQADSTTESEQNEGAGEIDCSEGSTTDESAWNEYVKVEDDEL